MDHNLYWNTRNEDYVFNDGSFLDWKKTNHDQHSIIADPHFVDPENYNFEFKDRKTVRRIGFKPFDISSIGVYGDRDWVEKAQLPEAVLRSFDKKVEHNMLNQ
ncbi:hypothetical protein GCM10028791_35860 [Echinicola sediminis]